MNGGLLGAGELKNPLAVVAADAVADRRPEVADVVLEVPLSKTYPRVILERPHISPAVWGRLRAAGLVVQDKRHA